MCPRSIYTLVLVGAARRPREYGAKLLGGAISCRSFTTPFAGGSEVPTLASRVELCSRVEIPTSKPARGKRPQAAALQQSCTLNAGFDELSLQSSALGHMEKRVKRRKSGELRLRRLAGVAGEPDKPSAVEPRPKGISPCSLCFSGFNTEHTADLSDLCVKAVPNTEVTETERAEGEIFARGEGGAK